MPTYEYQCKACGKQFEIVHSMREDDRTKCEACGEEALERLISRTAFQLKGGGWYRDLYSGAPQKEAHAERVAKGKADDTSSISYVGPDGHKMATPPPQAAKPSGGDSGGSSTSSSGGEGGGSGGGSSGGSTPPKAGS